MKQLDGLGPNGETIMDYSIYDAIRAGFGKLVFVIRKDFEQDFRDKILSKYESHIPCELVFQALDNLPEGFTCPAERTDLIEEYQTRYNIINEYAPQLMSAEEVKTCLQEKFAEVLATKNKGQIMKAVMGELKGKADGKVINQVVGELCK